MFTADHTCFLVSDIRKEQEFYEKALNFRFAEERRPDEKVTMVFLTDESGTCKLQLVQGRGPAHPEFGHIALINPDIEEAYEMHSRMGCVKGSMIVKPAKRSYFIRDPEGYEIEILER